MMRHGTPPIAALGRSLALLEAILADREGLSVSAIAASIGLPRATAHRQVTTLIAEGYLTRHAGARLGPGPRLLDLVRLLDEKQMIVTAAAPLLHRLADRLQCLVQLGTLENDMVTYRIKTGRGADDLFTRVGMQLEAYCTGMGKVLLADLPEERREAYLGSGPFPALTRKTITDPAELRLELAKVAAQGFAQDREEIAEGLECLAVPVLDRQGKAIAAISASWQLPASARQQQAKVLSGLMDTAQRLGDRIACTGAPGLPAE